MSPKSAIFLLLWFFHVNIIRGVGDCIDIRNHRYDEIDVYSTVHRTCTYRMIYNPHKYHLTVDHTPDTSEYRSDTIEIIDVVIEYSLISNLRFETFTGVNYITNLIINSSQIQNIDANAFKDFTYLKTLHLFNNSISNLKNHTFYSLQLEVLNISNNKIRNIEIEAFENLPRIEMIDLSFNKIFTLEGVFQQLGNLKQLNLSNNELTLLDKTVLPSLEVLDISNNKIRSIPERAFAESPELHTINLADNTISNLNNAFANCPSLISLNLCTNSISKISIESFKNLTNLIILDLCDNNLSSWDIGVFGGMSKLTYLDVSMNMLTAISTNTFIGLHSLKWLNISHNQIRAISGYPFHNTPYLISLDISFNGLSTFNLQELTQLQSLHIKSNNFKCSTLSKLLKNFKHRGVRVGRGNVFEETSIHGIACEDFDDSSNASTDNAKDVLEKYFQEDFRQSNFIKFLQNNRDVKMDDDYLEELMKAMMAYEKQSLENSRDFQDSNVNKLSSILTTNILVILLFVAIITLFIIKNFKKIKFDKLLEKNVSSRNELESII